MMHKLPTRPRNWLLLAGLGLLYLLLNGCASQPASWVAPALPAARTSVAETAQNMVGAPYRPGGSSPRGFDCSGLVSYSYGRAGIAVPRTAAQQFAHAKPVGRRPLEPGDLLFFNTEGRKVSHVGIYIGHRRFVHAPGSGKQVMLESLDNPYWHRRMTGAGHYF